MKSDLWIVFVGALVALMARPYLSRATGIPF